MQYCLGVDGGNTKCDYMLFTSTGQLVGHLRSGTASHEALADGYDGARQEMSAGVNTLLGRHGLNAGDVAASAWGLAGVDTPKQQAVLEGILRGLGFAHCKVMNDGFLGVKAGSATGVGVCSINGTGTVTCGIDARGQWLQVGGIGFISSDDAGGGHIALMVLRAVYDELFRLGEKTLLTPKVFALLGVLHPQDYIPEVYERQQHSDKAFSLSLIELLYDAAEEGDALALSLIYQVAKTLAVSCVGCISRLTFEEPVPLVLAGSVWAKSRMDYMEKAFIQHVKTLLDKDFTLCKLTVPPACGAVLWAMELALGQVPDGAARRRVVAQLEALL